MRETWYTKSMAPEEGISRAVSQQMFGTKDVKQALTFSRLEKPRDPKPGTVIVRITVRPLHPYDLFVVRNSLLLKFVSTGRSFDIVTGCEGVGVVEEVGEGVKSVKKGDRVIPILMWELLESGRGSWQDYVVSHEQDLIPVPDEMSDEDAAQFICNPWTAYGVVKDLGCPEGGFILLNGAGSVLGRMIIKLAKHWGFKTVNLVRRDELKKELEELGADFVFNTSTQDVVAKVKEVTEGAGVDGAIDMLGGINTKIAAASVKNGGKLFTIGTLESSDAVISTKDLFRKVQYSTWSLHNTKGKQDLVAEQVMKLFKAQVFQPLSGKKFNLEEYEAAIQETESTARGGKVLLVS